MENKRGRSKKRNSIEEEKEVCIILEFEKEKDARELTKKKCVHECLEVTKVKPFPCTPGIHKSVEHYRSACCPTNTLYDHSIMAQQKFNSRLKCLLQSLQKKMELCSLSGIRENHGGGQGVGCSDGRVVAAAAAGKLKFVGQVGCKVCSLLYMLEEKKASR